jgi:mannose/fructose-specific phosphotransferase system component IIA
MKAPAGRVPGLLVAHAGLAEELRIAAREIFGSVEDLKCLTNRSSTPEALADAITRVLDEKGPGIIVMVDLAGGSCLAAVLKACRGRKGVGVVAGVNLALILDFLQNRDSLPAEKLLDHMIERGHAGLKVIPAC